DLVGNFLAGNPHADSQGNAAVWHFSDMAGSHRLARMPAVDRLLIRWDSAVIQDASGDEGAIEEAAREIERAVVADGPEGALAWDLTGPRSPFRVKDRDDARYLGPEVRDDLTRLTRELENRKAQTPPLPYAHGVQEGGLRSSPYPGFQDARIHV